jgi:hypothetical protein
MKLQYALALAAMFSWIDPSYGQVLPSPNFHTLKIDGVLQLPCPQVISGLLKANGAGTCTGAVAGTDYVVPNGPGDGLTYTQTGAGAVASSFGVFVKGDFTPQQFNTAAGTGGDDSAAINAAILAASHSTGPNAGLVRFPAPASGFYNVCADSMRIQPTAGGTTSVTLRGTSSGGATIRAMPGCASSAVTYATAYMDGSVSSENIKSRAKISIENLRIDGNCISQHTFYDAYSVGLSFHNTVLRNAKSGGEANFLQASGYETTMDSTNRLENINDTPNACYTSAAALPKYNLETYGTDSHLYPAAINAYISNYYQANGGNNDFSHAHGWGYANTDDGQSDLRPKYNYVLLGSVTAVAYVADSFTTSGMYLSPVVSNGNYDSVGGQIIGGRCEAAVATSGQCIELDSSVSGKPAKNYVIIGNNTQGIGNGGSNPIKIDGVLDGSNIIRDNPWVSGNTPVQVGGKLLGTQATTISSDTGNSYFSCSSASALGGDPCVSKITANGANGLVSVMINGSNTAVFHGTTSPANYLDFYQTGSTSAPSIGANGSDANISVNLIPKGSGGVTSPNFASFGNGSFPGGVLYLQNSAATCSFTPSTGGITPSCSSDARLKQDIKDAGGQLEWLDSFKIRDYVLKSDGKRYIGPIAQEVQGNHPEMVHEQMGGMLSVDAPSPWAMIKAMQDMRRQITLLWASLLGITTTSALCFAVIYRKSRNLLNK